MRLALPVLAAMASVALAAGEVPQPAPLNPTFVRFAQDATARQAATAGEAGPALGYLPAPVSLSHLGKQAAVRQIVQGTFIMRSGEV